MSSAKPVTWEAPSTGKLHVNVELCTSSTIHALLRAAGTYEMGGDGSPILLLR